MRDPSDRSDAAQASGDVTAQLTRSLTSVWQHHAGAKPSGTDTEVTAERVRFVLADAVAGEPQTPVADDEAARSTESQRYRQDAIAAVTRITGRKVMGFIPKRDAKTDIASDTYILEPGRTRN
jgi:hypothetical protein